MDEPIYYIQASTLREDEIRVIPLSDEMPQPAMKKILNIYTATRSIMSSHSMRNLTECRLFFAPKGHPCCYWPDFPIPPNQLDFEKEMNRRTLAIQRLKSIK